MDEDDRGSTTIVQLMQEQPFRKKARTASAERVISHQECTSTTTVEQEESAVVSQPSSPQQQQEHQHTDPLPSLIEQYSRVPLLFQPEQRIPVEECRIFLEQCRTVPMHPTASTTSTSNTTNPSTHNHHKKSPSQDTKRPRSTYDAPEEEREEEAVVSRHRDVYINEGISTHIPLPESHRFRSKFFCDKSRLVQPTTTASGTTSNNSTTPPSSTTTTAAPSPIKIRDLANASYGQTMDRCEDTATLCDNFLGRLTHTVLRDALDTQPQFVLAAVLAARREKSKRMRWTRYTSTQTTAATNTTTNTTTAADDNNSNSNSHKTTSTTTDDDDEQDWWQVLRYAGQAHSSDDHSSNIVAQHPLFHTKLRAAVLHDQEHDQNEISWFPFHRDKFGVFICLTCLEGESYNFVAIPNGDPTTTTSSTAPTFVPTHGYAAYERYKTSGLSPDELRKVNAAERMFLRQLETERKNHTKVMVYHLQEGHQLCFDAVQYLHMTIVPASRRRRALLVSHELVQTS